MTEKRSISTFRNVVWLVPVCLLIFLAPVAQTWTAVRIPDHTTSGSLFSGLAFVVPLVIAIVVMQRIILARSHYSPAFAGVLAACFVAILGALAFLLILLFALFFVPSALV